MLKYCGSRATAETPNSLTTGAENTLSRQLRLLRSFIRTRLDPFSPPLRINTQQIERFLAIALALPTGINLTKPSALGRPIEARSRGETQRDPQ
jgi:hypothetical protein